MKAFKNTEGKLVNVVDGNIVEAKPDEVQTFTDKHTVESIKEAYGIDVEGTGLELVTVDVTINKAKPEYSVSPNQPKPSLPTEAGEKEEKDDNGETNYNIGGE